MLLFGCLSFGLFVVLESLNLGDAGDLENRDSQTLPHIRITWEVLILLCQDQAPDHGYRIFSRFGTLARSFVKTPQALSMKLRLRPSILGDY